MKVLIERTNAQPPPLGGNDVATAQTVAPWRKVDSAAGPEGSNRTYRCWRQPTHFRGKSLASQQDEGPQAAFPRPL